MGRRRFKHDLSESVTGLYYDKSIWSMSENGKNAWFRFDIRYKFEQEAKHHGLFFLCYLKDSVVYFVTSRRNRGHSSFSVEDMMNLDLSTRFLCSRYHKKPIRFFWPSAFRTELNRTPCFYRERGMMIRTHFSAFPVSQDLLMFYHHISTTDV